MSIKFSIIIPVKAINDYVKESIPHLLALDYPDYEILIFPDELPTETLPEQFGNALIRIIPSGKTGPAQKRDMALTYATGNIFAFIDDDAYPRADWLKNAVKYFADGTIGAVGGPAVTPENDTLLQKAGGRVLESPLCSGQYVRRYKPAKEIEDDDLPSVNLIVRRSVFESIGGFDSDYYPGEDTKLCLDITRNQHRRILYTPEVLVYHHRRALFIPHLKQISNYARHRGYFMKKLPQTSLRLPYLIPLAFLLGIVVGPIVAHFFPILWSVYYSVLAVYAVLDFITIFRIKTPLVSTIAFFGLFATHITYGIFTVVGLFQKKLTR